MLRGNQPRLCLARTPWNKGRLIGQKRPLKPNDVWAIRVRLQLEQRKRDLALFNLGIDRSFTVGGHRWCEPLKRTPHPEDEVATLMIQIARTVITASRTE